MLLLLSVLVRIPINSNKRPKAEMWVLIFFYLQKKSIEILTSNIAEFLDLLNARMWTMILNEIN